MTALLTRRGFLGGLLASTALVPAEVAVTRGDPAVLRDLIAMRVNAMKRALQEQYERELYYERGSSPRYSALFKKVAQRRLA